MDKGVARVNVKALSNALTYIAMNLVRTDDESKQLKAAYTNFEDATFKLMQELLRDAHPDVSPYDADREMCKLIERSIDAEEGTNSFKNR